MRTVRFSFSHPLLSIPSETEFGQAVRACIEQCPGVDSVELHKVNNAHAWSWPEPGRAGLKELEQEIVGQLIDRLGVQGYVLLRNKLI